jgi:hypothetical protein
MQMGTRDQTQHGDRHDGPARPLVTALLALLALLALSAPAALAAEPCPNQQLRTESNLNPTSGQPYSTQLPDCRGYELVSPPNTGGMPAILGGAFGGGLQFLVTPNGSIFFESQATPAGTGALPDGGYIDVFRSRRAAYGWLTQDMLPSPQPGDKFLEGVSVDGASVLIDTSLTLNPEDVDNPTGATTYGQDLYVARDNGTPPEFVTHGEVPNRPTLELQGRTGVSPVANADLSAVGFQTRDSLAKPINNELVTPGCYVWASVEDRLARLTNPDAGGTLSPPLNCKYFAIAADGRPIIEDTSGDGGEGLIFAADPAGEPFPTGGGTRQLSGNKPFAATFAAISSDHYIVYISTTDQLVPNADSGADIYGVDLTQAGLSSQAPPEAPALTCISCDASGIPSQPNVGDARYVGQSADGSHVFFNVAGALYEHDSAGTRLVASAADGLENVIFSHSGQYVIAKTSVALSASDTDGAPDIYELSDGAAPKLITNGISSTDSYTPVAVSDHGQQVLYEDTPNGAPSLIDEWVSGQIGQVSPAGSTHSYKVLGTAGPALEDVFFAANEPLVPQDLNAGTTAIYDARVDGGFPAPAQPANDNQTPNPAGPVTPAYTTSLTAPSFQLAVLPADTSQPASRPKVKPLTQAQKLAKALKACKKQPKRKRAACDAQARRKYGTKTKKRTQGGK